MPAPAPTAMEVEPAAIDSEMAQQVQEIADHIRHRSRFRRVGATLCLIDEACARSGELVDDDGLEPDHDDDALDQLKKLCDENDGVEIEIDCSKVRLPPPGKTWARVTRNLAPPEDWKQEFFVPYLGEGKEEMDAATKLAKELSEEEQDKEKKNALFWFNLSPFKDVVQDDSIKEQADDSDAEGELYDHSRDRTKESYARGAWDRAYKRETVFSTISHYGPEKFKPVTTVLSRVLNISEEAVCRYFANSMFRRYRWFKQERHERIMRKHKEDICRWIRKEERTDTKTILDSNSVSYFFCRRCKTMDCTLHGVGIDLTPKIVPFDGTRKDTVDKKRRDEIEQSCEHAGLPTCWIFHQVTQEDAMVLASGNTSDASRMPNGVPNGHHAANGCGVIPSTEVVNLISDDDEPVVEDEDDASKSIFEKDEGARGLLVMFHRVFGNDPCRVAEAFNSLGIYSEVTCFAVGKYMSESLEDVQTGALIRPPKPHSRDRPNKALISKKEHAVMKKGKRLDYKPCDHDGPCTKENCSCIQNALFCEKFCRCSSPRVNGDRTHECDKCENLFWGCECADGCKDESCDCVAAKRECDPDVCTCANWADARNKDVKDFGCNNVGLRFNRIARIVCGHSDVHGWGVYACAPIAKGTLIGQYTGEVLKDQDGERRGRVYDQIKTSFLFNTTEDYIVDSTRLGNKLRYINHSHNHNCIPRLMRVDGDIVIGIYASQDIQAFEELLFDYGYGQNGPEFARKNSKSAKKRKPNPVASKTAVKGSQQKRAICASSDSSGTDGEADDPMEDDPNDADFVA